MQEKEHTGHLADRYLSINMLKTKFIYLPLINPLLLYYLYGFSLLPLRLLLHILLFRVIFPFCLLNISIPQVAFLSAFLFSLFTLSGELSIPKASISIHLFTDNFQISISGSDHFPQFQTMYIHCVH